MRKLSLTESTMQDTSKLEEILIVRI